MNIPIPPTSPRHRMASGSGAYRITRDKEETRRAATSDLRAREGDQLVVRKPPLLAGCQESLEGTCAPMTGTGTVGAQTRSTERGSGGEEMALTQPLELRKGVLEV